MKIGMAGTGRMGAAIAQRLAGRGHQVTVWNRTVDKARALGLPVAENPSRLLESSDIIISILTDASAIEAVYAKLLSGDVKRKLFIEMSTVRPETQKRLAEKVKAKGAALVECPVGGTVGPAKDGKLFGFAGGEAADVARAEPLRIDPARLMDIFADTSGGPNLLKVRGKAIASVLAGNDPGPVTFNVDSMRKDMRTMIEEARALGHALPVVERALECFDSAARAGLGEADCTMLPVAWLKRLKTQ